MVAKLETITNRGFGESQTIETYNLTKVQAIAVSENSKLKVIKYLI